MEKIKLNNDIKIPVIGFGPGGVGYSDKYKNIKKNKVYKYTQGVWNKFIKQPAIYSNYVKSITSAIQNGFRLIDYSAAYGNGVLLKRGIERSGIVRDELILTTRVSNKAQFSNTVEEEFFEQLKNLKLDYFDILMFHWPVPEYWHKTWETMVELKKRGYVKTLGVANCKQHHLKELMEISDFIPAINQIEVHPLFTQKDEISFCKEHGIRIEAYTPIARFDDRLMRLPVLKKIGEKYGKSVIQIVLRWHIQNDVIPIVRTLSSLHQQENLNIFDFKLTPDEMKTIDGININSRLRYDSDNCDFSIL